MFQVLANLNNIMYLSFCFHLLLLQHIKRLNQPLTLITHFAQMFFFLIHLLGLCGIFPFGSQSNVLIYCPRKVGKDSLAVESEDVLLVSSYQHSWAVEAAGQRVQPGHVQHAGTVAGRHRKTHKYKSSVL